MSRTLASSESAQAALELVESLQQRFAERLTAVHAPLGDAGFAPIHWLRDDGRHGGGVRLATGDTAGFDRASVNVSQVHYDDLPDKPLESATALSTIIHPRHPHCPSVHIHLSWTGFKDGRGGWRWMADLNPSIPHEGDTARFVALLESAAGEHLAGGLRNGDRYFWIPALERHRGVAHFYLEGHATDDPEADRAATRHFGETVLDGYASLLADALERSGPPTEADRQAQLAYHTLYLFQVLTLDRGTTSGLLVHSDNDVGVLGSLPSHVDRALLASWAAKVPSPQERLVAGIVDALPAQHPSPVTDAVKAALAEVSRTHYRTHPDALRHQARGEVIPTTVANHRPEP